MRIVPPTVKHLSRAYHELSRFGARAVGSEEPWPYRLAEREDLLALAADLSRYDPRLFGILVELIGTHWADFNPLRLRRAMRDMDCPQTLLAVFAFSAAVDGHGEVEYFGDYLGRGYGPVEPQLYFKNIYSPGGVNMRRAALEPVEEFLRWGFLARERPVIHDATGARRQAGHWGPSARRNVIFRLASEREKFGLAEYLESVDHSVSRQQALADLKNSPHVKLCGKGRGSAWRRVS